jgi:uncharacterized protein YhfF
VSDYSSLPRAEFAFPGALRDQLVAAILDGSKTSTTSTVVEYSIENERFPEVGDRAAVITSVGDSVAIIEVTEVRRARLAEVDLQHAIDEGEGFGSVAEWRVGHIKYWESAEMREFMDDPEFTVSDDTELVLERFRVVELL